MSAIDGASRNVNSRCMQKRGASLVETHPNDFDRAIGNIDAVNVWSHSFAESPPLHAKHTTIKRGWTTKSWWVGFGPGGYGPTASRSCCVVAGGYGGNDGLGVIIDSGRCCDGTRTACSDDGYSACAGVEWYCSPYISWILLEPMNGLLDASTHQFPGVVAQGGLTSDDDLDVTGECCRNTKRQHDGTDDDDSKQSNDAFVVVEVVSHIYEPKPSRRGRRTVVSICVIAACSTRLSGLMFRN